MPAIMVHPRPQAADVLAFPPSGEMGGYYILGNVLNTTRSGFVAPPGTGTQSIPVSTPVGTKIGVLQVNLSASCNIGVGKPSGRLIEMATAWESVAFTFRAPFWNLTSGIFAGVITPFVATSVAINQWDVVPGIGLNPDSVKWGCYNDIAPGASYSIQMHADMVYIR